MTFDSPFFRSIGPYIPFKHLRVLFYRAGGATIGKGTLIDRHVRIGPNVRIGRKCRVREFTNLHDCELGDKVTVEPYCMIRYARIGERSLIDRGSMVYGQKDDWVGIGKDVGIGSFWKVDGTGGLVIEDSVTLGSHIGGVFTHSNVKQCLTGVHIGESEYIERKSVRIGKCSWIGGMVTVQPGVKIGMHCVVLPNSTVTMDLEPYTMASGLPAEPIKRIRIQGEKVEFLPIES